MTASSEHVYQFKVTLKSIRPPIWRRIHVPETYTFWDLHVAIQDAMGWLDDHLHAFFVKNPKSGDSEEIGIPEETEWTDHRVLAGWERGISGYFSTNNPKALYVYDFGDDWAHDITLEKILPREKGLDYPLCLKGKRACPPEDCGGVFGYRDLLQILSDPEDEEYEETLEWLGEDFDPESFDPEAIDFWDPEERLEMILGGERDMEGEEEDDPDKDMQWLTRDYLLDILEIAKKGDLNVLDPDERRLADILMEHKEEFSLDPGYARDCLDQETEGEESDPFLHITIHAVVEDQLAEKDPVEVLKFYNAMRRKGCTRHDAIHLIGAILVPLLFGNMIEEKSFDLDTYRALLKKYKTRKPEKILDLLENEPGLFPDEMRLKV